MPLPPPTPAAYWSRDPAELRRELGAGEGGLTRAEAATRLRLWGANAVQEESSLAPWRLLLRQFASPLVLILVFGAAISLLLREWVDAAIIFTVVIGSNLLGFTQEHRASAAVAELRKRLALTTRVLREGQVETLPVSSLVPGDLVLLSAGNLVPADGILLEAKDFLVSEASLTGETFPVEKRPGVVAADAPLTGRSNCVFLGTSVRSGSATVLIVATGRHTLFGEVAARLRTQMPPTEFARGLDRFGALLLRVMLLMVFFVLTINQLLGRPFVESLLFAVALAVGLSPELLPAIVSVTLSKGAREMAAGGVIVRRLEAIENLGCIDVLCTDKTGTLTEGKLRLEAAVNTRGEEAARVLEQAYVNAALETGIENPLDLALVAAGEAAGLDAKSWRKLDEIPYDFLRRRLTIVAMAPDGRRLLLTKGAFREVLAVCSTFKDGGEVLPLEAAAKERLEAYFAAIGQRGLRLLAFAAKEVVAQEHYGHADEAGLCLEGFLLFADPIKDGVAATIGELSRRGIGIKIITGDNRFVAAHIAEKIGIDPQAMLHGSQLTLLSDEALWHLAERIQLFVEVDRQQKERIVRARQRTGHAVGYLGDGINDAPALHAADVGISVDSAVDVARESADIVLLRHDLEVLKGGVDNGRRTFANTLKYISITTSANFGNMVSMALATPLLPFLPLAAKQILLNNFLSDLPSMTISADQVDPENVLQAQRFDLAEVRRFMVIFGLISTCFDLVTFALLLKVFEANEATFQSAWFVISLLTELAVVLVLRTRRPAWRSRPSALLLFTTAATAALAIALPFLPWLDRTFDFVPLSAGLMATLLGTVAAYIAATEATKIYRERRQHG